MSDADGRDRRRERALWVAREIIPYEASMRAWLRRSRVDHDAADEIIQEAYCRLSQLDTVAHIDVPNAYFLAIVRSLLLRRLKRQRVVPFEAIASADAIEDEQPSAEATIAGRLALQRVERIIARLPDRCQRIVRLKKIDGWSQKQIAAHLGTTEKAVEKQVSLGIRFIREAWSAGEREGEERFGGLARRIGGES